jgi:hypothetical protein
MSEDLFTDDGRYKILIDGRWTLEDLYKFPRAYEQVYFAIYSLMPHDDEDTSYRISRAYSVFPWQGGYSAVNFYNQLKYTMPRRDRPEIKSIQYASPGWIELSMLVTIAGSIALIVKSICSAINNVNNTYTNIHKGMSERKLLRFETKSAEIDLAKKHAKFIRDSNKEMASILLLDNIEEIDRRTGSELKTLKIFLSLYRRVKVLADFQIKKKAKL